MGMGSRCWLVAGVAAVGLSSACSDDGGAGGAGGANAGGAGGGASITSWLEDDCGVCVLDSCAAAIDACNTDPFCSTYWECVGNCPPNAFGNADSDCDEACNDAAGTESAKLRSDVTACRQFGGGFTCEACELPALEQDPPPQSCREYVPPRGTDETPCRTCYWEHCCETWDACFGGNNPDCDELVTCMQACSDAPCTQACFEQHPDSAETALAQLSCSAVECAAEQDECDISQRDICDICLFDTCGGPYADMLADPDAFLIFSCAGDCGDADEGVECLEDCVATHPDGADVFFLWGECVSFQCTEEC